MNCKFNPFIFLLTIVIFVAVPLLFVSDAFAQLAFPGAEGFGAHTRGAYASSSSPRIIRVTNLNNSGTGSLRAALEASGPRVVVFEVSGTIELSSRITINDSYLTVAGQTSPGGVQIKGDRVVIDSGADEIIIRGMRFRPGVQGGSSSLDNKDAFGMEGGSTMNNIILDHCSFQWGTDETVCVFNLAQNVTIQHSIIAEALYDVGHPDGPHGSGFLIAGSGSPRRITVHHNLLAHNMDRNPRLAKGAFDVEIINNVIYDWRHFATDIEGAGDVYLVGNKYIHGPATTSDRLRVASANVYVENNIGPGRPTNTGNEWDIVTDGSESYRAYSVPFSLSGVNEDNVNNIEDIVLADVGANPSNPDSAEERIIRSVRNRTGSMVNSPPGGWPTLSGSAPSDADNDGMPDWWERQECGSNTCLNPHGGLSTGYSHLERYVNSFYAGDTTPPPPPDTYCGDNTCNGNETCSDCPGDCGACPPPEPYCGDDLCNGNETCETCELDCGVCPPPPPSGVIEAESGVISAPMQRTADAGASGAYYIETTTNDSGEARYVIHVSEAGQYKIVGMVRAMDSSADSFFVQVDGQETVLWDLNPSGDPSEYAIWREDEVTNRYSQNSEGTYDPYLVDLSSGEHVIIIHGRESHASLDYFYLVKADGPEPPLPFCGDAECNGDETCEDCEQDCGVCPPPPVFCGDNACNGDETCATCSDDCGSCCGDGTCSAEEESFTCPEDCARCGDNICQEERQETCLNCPGDCGACPPPEPYCGDQECNGDETCETCELDCGVCPPPPPSGVIEAESGVISAPMQRTADAGASGAYYIETTTNDSGQARYVIHVSEAGQYKIIGMVRAMDSSADSFFVQVDGQETVLWDLNPSGDPSEYAIWREDEVTNRYSQNSEGTYDPYLVDLSSGEHVIIIHGRESHASLDYFYLVKVSDGSPPVFCGDTLCNGDETCATCSDDCGSCCGDGTCSAEEESFTCPEDCARCGDNICQEERQETCLNCPGDCGACPPPEPYCGDQECNGDETCETCELDCGVCPPPVCGDDQCNDNETCASCEADCGVCPPPSRITEAETGILTSPMLKKEYAEASGGYCIKTSVDEEGMIRYSINVAESGQYKIVGRVYAENSSRDSFYVQIDGQEKIPWELNPSQDAGEYLVWREDEVTNYSMQNSSGEYAPYIFDLTQGAHTLVVHGKESFTRLDYFYLVRVGGSAPPPPPPVCGDSVCNGDETCSTCEVDCEVCPIQSIDVRVIDGSDDVEERDSGRVDFSSSDLELAFDSSRTGHQKIGIRFQSLAIPQGATVSNAYVQFKVDETRNASGTLVIEGHNVDNAPVFSKNNYDVSSRTKTSASVMWNPPKWTKIGQSGADHRTVDISSIIQEVVNRPGWQSGNSIVIIISGTGQRVAESYNGDAGGAPLLHVEYME